MQPDCVIVIVEASVTPERARQKFGMWLLRCAVRILECRLVIREEVVRRENGQGHAS
jgi:hypothetical protein